MTTIGKTFTFEAAHRLQRHKGKCKKLHGHSYRVEVRLDGPIVEDKDSPDFGMVVDFGELKEWWKPLEKVLDHVTILEDGDPLVKILEDAGQQVTILNTTPTAENIAKWLWADIYAWCAGRQMMPIVRVWETATSWAEA